MNNLTTVRGIRRGFTLIELLVVIAIIAILAAILFPVFAQAKAAAKKTAAISNAKEIVLGEIMYQGDVDDNFVPYFSGYTPSTKTYSDPSIYWPENISPYISKANKDKTANQALIQNLSAVFIDPMKGASATTVGTTVTTGNITSWGISDDIVDWVCPSDCSQSYAPRNASAAAAPASTLIFTETWDIYSAAHNLPGIALAYSYFDSNNSAGTAPSTNGNGAQQTLDSPHNASYKRTTRYKNEPDPKGFNVTAFIDGHTKAMVTGQLTRQGTYWSLGNNNQWP